MIEAEKADPDSTMTISRMCRLLGVDRRRFYEWRARVAAGPSLRQQRAASLTVQIREFHAASDGTYGPPGSTPTCRMPASWSLARRSRS